MTLTLHKVRKEHLDRLFQLSVSDEQNDQVAPNAFTLAEQAYEPGSYVWGIWSDDQPVGLLAMINPKEAAHLDEGDDPDAAYIWRLMIGQEFQNKGYGRDAMKLAFEQIRAWTLPRVCLTFYDKPGGAEGFYKKLGFVRTGRVIGGEHELMLTL